MPHYEIDRLIGTQEFAALLDVSTRTLANRIKCGAVPAPDRPAMKLGEGHKWRLSTVRAAIESPAPQQSAA